MILISHRGNINGPDPSNENKPSYITNAIRTGFQVEVDFWFKNNKFFLGHDEPQYAIPFEWFQNIHRSLWIHCKNIDAMNKLVEIDRGGVYLNYFWHEDDKLTLTSKGYIWAYPGVKCENAITVMPELPKEELKDYIGICSDNIMDYV
jgi:hypothetical protein|tara:strand:+ start:88 stop:531 length:444 start_codon:yes stop_codon:yes gene_type:complete